MSVQYQKRYFNVNEYYLMAEAGVLTESDRVELIDGEIIEMSPIGSRHAACVRRLGALLIRLLDQEAIVSIQSPVRLNDFSEPEPDIALLKPRSDFYAQAHPRAEDLLVIIEVADTWVEYDRRIKAPLYSRAEIPEAWVVNLREDVIEVYAEAAKESYEQCRAVRRGEELISRAIPSLRLKVDDILG